MNLTARIILTIVCLLVLDFTWIFLNKNMYDQMVKNVQHSTMMNVRMISAILAYILMIVGFIFIIVPQIVQINKNKNKFVTALRYGGLFGLVVYGIYNTTNYAIFTDYPLHVALMDTAWGVSVYTLTTYIFLLLQ